MSIANASQQRVCLRCSENRKTWSRNGIPHLSRVFKTEPDKTASPQMRAFQASQQRSLIHRSRAIPPVPVPITNQDLPSIVTAPTREHATHGWNQ